MRRLSLLVALVLVCPAAAFAAQENTQRGAELFIRKGCLGCHGASGRGGVGPPLANIRLSLNDFLKQLRQPRGIMPPFHARIVSDDEARQIHAYLETTPPPAPKLRQDLPKGNLDPTTCLECHRKFNPMIVAQFEQSAMGMAGTQNPRVVYPQRQITCANCHGTDHDLIMQTRGRVAETMCAACHPQIYKDAVLDAGHSYGPGPGGLGINWERNIGVPHYKQMPRKVLEMGCDPCHAQGGGTDDKYWSAEQKKYIDTSSFTMRNGCVACHTRHAFNLEEARKPEACYTCHMGPDHPNFEAYMASKHGSIYAARGDKWDFTQPLPQAQFETPTCAYCHMLYVAPDGTRTSNHNMTRKIIWGMGVQAATGEIADITLTPENAAKRNEMIKVCITCHSEDRARGYLESADAHKLSGDVLVLQARDILAGLYKDGLIKPSHGQVSAGLLEGPHFSAIELPGGIASHSPTSLYYDVAPIEREYFDMFFFSSLKSYKGAFHMSPDYAWWYGYADVLGHLATIRDEDHRLREARSVRNRTLFMIATGPLMVLAVIGGVWMLVRWRRKRRGAPARG